MSNKNKLETWGNESTMNMNAILYQNILASPYFKSLYDKKTFHEIVDEIYNEVTNLSPFIKGTTPSTAFCCLYKFWTLRLTVKQVENLVDHPDSPYIRSVGFLYLRYVCAPAQLWDWFQYYLDDDEEIDLTGGPRPQKSTIGKLVRMLIVEQKFQGTMLPRIPVPIARDLNKKLEDYDKENHQSSSRQENAGRRSPSPAGRRDGGYDDRRRDRGRDEFDAYEHRRDAHMRRDHRDRRDNSRSRYDDGHHRRRRSLSPRDRRDRYRSYSRSRSRSRSHSSGHDRYSRHGSGSRDRRRY